MPKFQNMLNNPRQLKAMTGLDRAEFEQLLPHFARALERIMVNRTMDGYERENRRYTEYSNSPLPALEDKLLFILTYLKINPIQAVQGQMFGMTQPTVSKWLHLLHDVLNHTLAAQNYLPARNAPALSKLLQSTSDTPRDVEDATNEASSRVFFTMARNVR